MNVVCDVKTIKNALNLVSKALENSQIEILNAIEIKTNKDEGNLILSAFNGTMKIVNKIPCDVEEEGNIFINGKLFNNMIRQLDDDVDVVLNSNEKEVTIKSQKIKIKQKLTLIKERQFNNFDFENMPYIEVDIDTLNEIIQRALSCISTDNSRPILKGINLKVEPNKCKIASLDGFRVSTNELDILTQTIDTVNVTIPPKMLSLLPFILNGKETIKIYFDKTKQVIIRTDDIEVSSALIGGEYFNYEKVIPKAYNFTVKFKTEELRQYVSLALYVKENMQTPHICFDFSANNSEPVNISSKSEIVEFSNSMECEIVGESKDMTIMLNAIYLNDILKTIKKENIIWEITENNRPVVIKGNEKINYSFMLLPIRVAN